MLGNDLVDLCDPETRPAALHPRFDQRVFCESERALIANSEDAHLTRWTLWAAKESAYKCLRKGSPQLVFSPRRFVVELAGMSAGVARYEDLTLSMEFERTDDFVHAVALQVDEKIQPAPRHRAEVSRVHGDTSPAASSRAVRALAIEGASALLDVPTAELSIEREGKIPRLCWRGCPSGVDLSLSHHGRFVAFAAMSLSSAVLVRGAA